MRFSKYLLIPSKEIALLHIHGSCSSTMLNSRNDDPNEVNPLSNIK